MVLRQIQRRTYVEMRKAYARGVRRLLVCAPTGFGKTVLIAFVVAAHLAKGGRVLVVVHRRELIGQTRAKLMAAGVARIGVIASGADVDPDAPVVIATVQTLLARGSLPDATMLVLDESHHYRSDEWRRIADHYSAIPVLGFSATPERSDGAALGDIFEEMIVAATVPELVELEYLVPCPVVAPSKRRRSLAGDPLDLWKEHAGGRPTVVFCASVEESRALAVRFRASGITAEHVDGETDAEERAARLDAFLRGDVRVLCNVFVLTEGWDAPRAEVCMLARGCSSAGAFLQMCGRVLRPSPETGKTSALLIDVQGAVHLHGLPDEARVFSLEGRPIGRGPTRTCPECEGEIPLASTACPLCGADLPAGNGMSSAVSEDGEALSRVDRAALERSFFMESLEIARSRGFRDGWVVHRFVERFGRKPWGLWREFIGSRRAA